jgi:CRP-like cAMP-binding protein
MKLMSGAVGIVLLAVGQLCSCTTSEGLRAALLFLRCVQVNYAAGEPVWSEREGGDLFYIIKEGSVLLKDASSGAVLSKLGPGAHFGQLSLLGPGAKLCT